jgi:hypothetical protein
LELNHENEWHFQISQPIDILGTLRVYEIFCRKHYQKLTVNLIPITSTIIPKVMRKTSTILILLSTLWLVLVCGCGFFTLLRPGLGTQWQQEPAPPEKIIRLGLGEAGEVLGYTADEGMYELSYGSPSAWEKVTQPSGNPVIGRSCNAAETTNRLVVSPPNEVLSRVRVNCVLFESAYHLEVALLEKGEVWSWEYSSYAYTEILAGFILLIAFGVGIILLLIGLGLVFYQKANKSRG